MKKDDLSAAGCTLAILYVPVMLLVAALAHGYALSVLWGWFIVPLFHLPVLTISQALGLGLVVGLLAKEVDDSGSTEEDKSIATILISGTIKSLIRPGFALLFGKILLQFM